MSKSKIPDTTNPSEGWGLAQQRQAPTHPGEMFRVEYREASEPPISQAEAARRMGMSTNRLNEIELGKRGVTAETAVLFGAITNTSPELWATLQMRYDLWHALQKVKHIKRVLPGEPFPIARRASKERKNAAVHSARPADRPVD